LENLVELQSLEA